MSDEKYQLKFSKTFTMYQFISEGPNGKIVKVIKYTKSKISGIYNLGFGDRIGNTSRFDDAVISDNQDSQKVLATVAATVYLFTHKYPNAYVFATGSTPSRTRLYRINISNNLEEIEKDFDVLGYVDKTFERFEKNKHYEGFLITRK